MGNIELSARLRAAMGDRSVRDVAEAAGLGHSYVWRLLRGRVADPSPHSLRALARALDLPYTDLLREAGYLP